MQQQLQGEAIRQASGTLLGILTVCRCGDCDIAPDLVSEGLVGGRGERRSQQKDRCPQRLCMAHLGRGENKRQHRDVVFLAELLRSLGDFVRSMG
jgi:hypothetical protein